MGLVIRGLSICRFAFSLVKYGSNRSNLQPKCVFLSANSSFEVQYSGTYQPRKTRFTCTCFSLLIKKTDQSLKGNKKRVLRWNLSANLVRRGILIDCCFHGTGDHKAIISCWQKVLFCKQMIDLKPIESHCHTRQKCHLIVRDDSIHFGFSS